MSRLYFKANRHWIEEGERFRFLVSEQKEAFHSMHLTLLFHQKETFNRSIRDSHSSRIWWNTIHCLSESRVSERMSFMFTSKRKERKKNIVFVLEVLFLLLNYSSSFVAFLPFPCLLQNRILVCDSWKWFLFPSQAVIINSLWRLMRSMCVCISIPTPNILLVLQLIRLKEKEEKDLDSRQRSFCRRQTASSS